MCTGKHCVLDTMCIKFGHILIQTVLLQFKIKRTPFRSALRISSPSSNSSVVYK